MDANQGLKKKLYKEGFIVLKKFFNEEEIKNLIELQNINHLNKNIIRPLGNYPEYWNLISNNKLLKILRDLLGDQIVFLHNSHSVIQKSDIEIDSNWHRDNVSRVYGNGPDWDKKTDYNVLRVAIYFPEKNNKTGLGVIPRTHIGKGYICNFLRRTRTEFKRIYHSKYFKFIINNILGKNIYVEQGDCVIFLANLYHRSLPTKGIRRAIFLSYGVNNTHAKNFLVYYLIQRDDSNEFKLNKEKVDTENFKKFLKNQDLYINFPQI